ncbi:hypothetical protein ACS0TY_005566 [Phlomoides rotata]
MDERMYLGDEIYESEEEICLPEDVMNQSSQSYSDEDNIFKNFSQGGDDAGSFSNSSLPIGLRLSTSRSFINLVQKRVSKDKSKTKTKTNDHLGRRCVDEKVKAANFPASSIRIGNWKRFSRHEGELTAKLYFAKRKLVWELLEGPLKVKIEFLWSDISAIRAITPENQPGTLEIQLNKPPTYFREVNPQPKKHTLWRQAPDFTSGQAPVWRIHIVSFKHGILDKHYEKLLQCNERLFEISQKPFPTHESPFFDPTTFGTSEMSLSFNKPFGSSYYQGLQYRPYQSYSAPPTEAPLSMSVMNLSYTNAEGNMNTNSFVTHQPQPTLWDQGPSYNSLAYDQSEPTDVINPGNNNYGNYSSTGYQNAADQNQMMQDAGNSGSVTGDFYSQQQHSNWSTQAQQYSDMDYQGSSSISPYCYPGYNPNSDGFY